MSENTAVETYAATEALVLATPSASSAIGFYSSIPAGSFVEKLAVLEALDNAAKVDDNRGKVIMLRNFIVEPYTYTDKESGETSDTARITLIDEDGVSYACSSGPVYNTLIRLRQIMGEPATWPEALPVTITKEGVAPRAYFALKVTPPETKKTK